jgi:hypothetical protein
MHHLSGKSLLTRFRFTVCMSQLTPAAGQAQMSHEYADNPQCPGRIPYKELHAQQAIIKKPALSINSLSKNRSRSHARGRLYTHHTR